MNEVTQVAAKRGELRFLLAMSLLYFLWRLLFLLFAHPFHYFVHIEEELFRGTIAKEIINGLKMPLWDYQADTYCGGSLVFGILAVPLFLLFGPSAFALKLLPVFFLSAALFFWNKLILCYSNAKTAFYFSLLFIFAPPAFVRYSTVPLGDHTEAIFFTAFTLSLFLSQRLFSNGNVAKNFVLGLVSGFSLWFDYLYGLTVLAMLSYWFLQDRQFYRRYRFWITAMGFLLGFMPWILSNIRSHFAGFHIHGLPFWDYFHWRHFLSRSWHWEKSSLFQLVTFFDLKHIVNTEDHVWVNLFFQIAFFVPMISAIIIYLHTPHKIPHTQLKQAPNHLFYFSLLYLLIFLVVVQFSSLMAPFYYLPVFPFIFYLSAHALELWERHASVQWKNLIKFYGVIYLCGSIFFIGKGFSWEDRGYGLKTKGYHYYFFIESPFCSNKTECLERYLGFEKRFDAHDEQIFIFEIAKSIAQDLPLANPKEEFVFFKKYQSPFFRRYLAYALGYELMARPPQHFKDTMEKIEFLKEQSEQLYVLAQMGIFLALFDDIDEFVHPNQMKKETGRISDSLKAEYWRGRGSQWARLVFKRKKSIEAVAVGVTSWFKKLDENEIKYFTEGIGVFFYQQWSYKPFAPDYFPDAVRRFPAKYHHDLLFGAGRIARFDGYLPQDAYPRMFLSKVPKRLQRYFYEGNEDYWSFQEKLGIILQHDSHLN